MCGSEFSLSALLPRSFLLQKNTELFDILVPAYPGGTGKWSGRWPLKSA